MEDAGLGFRVPGVGCWWSLAPDIWGDHPSLRAPEPTVRKPTEPCQQMLRVHRQPESPSRRAPCASHAFARKHRHLRTADSIGARKPRTDIAAWCDLQCRQLAPPVIGWLP